MTSPTNNVFDPNPPGYVDETSRAPGNYGKPFILNRVFDLLVLMIDVLQRTAAAQANRLNFLTQWQKAYTDELNQIHSFVASNGDGEARQLTDGGTINTGGSGTQDFRTNDNGIDKVGDDSSGKIRGELNSLNSIYTQQIQGNLNVISNDAKALQANVNQSNDSVQSQSDMATSILQQMSTILTSIYQSG
ncbi:MAG: hypothetical protein LLG04_16965 [Parachlamydia sp.]|nr:hypothetical protein [Parachlamydia sp.]